jgi:YihY family inner membrane protein
MNALQRQTRRIDEFQQRRPWRAFPFAVVKKFGDDRAGNLAALIAYYGFFSLFPLLLVFVSVLGLLLRNNPSLQQSILDSVLRDFPVIGDQLRSNIKGLTGGGAGVALGVGTFLALWGGLGVMNAAQNAFNDIWDVPMKDRPNFLESRLRGLVMLVVLGVMALASTFVSGIGTSEGGRFLWSGALALLVTLILNLGLYLVAFRVLTDRSLRWADVLPGAAVGAVLWTALQSLGSYYVQHQVKNASEVYGTFGLVIGLLTWIYLGAQITLLAAEVNVVRKNRLWPRSLLQKPPLAPADKRAMARDAKTEERIPEETVEATFEEGERTDGARKRDGFLRSVVVGAGVTVVGGLVSAARRRRKRPPPYS